MLWAEFLISEVKYYKQKNIIRKINLKFLTLNQFCFDSKEGMPLFRYLEQIKKNNLQKYALVNVRK